MRYGVGLRAAAAIATAAWIDTGVITQRNTYLAIDHNKIKRAQEKLMKSASEEYSEFVSTAKIDCLFFDGRIDMKYTMLCKEGSVKSYPTIIKEEHYTICSKPREKYLFHFTLNMTTDGKKCAESIADNLYKLLVERGIDQTLLAVGCDSTNVNTGGLGIAIHFLEEKIDRKLNCLVCTLHTNELPFQRLVITLDGRTLSNNRWMGPIGKLLDQVTELPINPFFAKVTIGDPLISLSPEVVEDLSSDQLYAYNIDEGIRSGAIYNDFALLKIGPVNHA